MQNSEDIDVPVDNGKYRVLFNLQDGLRALRYDQPWRDCVGDNLIYWLAVELNEAREKIKKLESINDKIADHLQLG